MNDKKAAKVSRSRRTFNVLKLIHNLLFCLLLLDQGNYGQSLTARHPIKVISFVHFNRNVVNLYAGVCYSIMLFGIGSLRKLFLTTMYVAKKVNQALGGYGHALACRQRVCIYFVYWINWMLLCEACTNTCTDTGRKATGKSNRISLSQSLICF